MLVFIAQIIAVLFGMFFIVSGFLMLLKPEWVRSTIAKAGSTNLINYGEISIRLIPGAALILASEAANYPEPFWWAGWFIVASSGVLFFVPPRLHNAYSVRSAEMLSPTLLRIIFPFAMLIGGCIVWNMVG
jgi:hypothetical protein